MTRNTLLNLAIWLRSIVLDGLRERAEKQAAGSWDYSADTFALTTTNGTYNHVAHILRKNRV